MDDEGEEISRRHRLKPETFVRSGLTSSCATPRHHWRSPSWNSCNNSSSNSSSSSSNMQGSMDKPPTPFTTFATMPPSSFSASSSSASPSSSSSSDPVIRMLCPSMQSLSLSDSKRNSKPALRLDLAALREQQQQQQQQGNSNEERCCEESEVSESDKEVQVRREKMVECDRQCTRILGHLYFGSKTVAENYAMLRRFRITHVINCVGFVCPNYFPNDFFYKRLWLQDSPSQDLICILYDIFDFIEDVREQAGGRVFIHCCQGVSRSASLVISYVMWRDRMDFDQAYSFVKSRRSVTSPNIGFVFQLTQWQSKILDPSSKQAINVFRIAPHSLHDPLNLLPKSTASSTFDALDSRGVFVVQLPSHLYVWRGRSSDRAMAAAGERAAFQLIRYEHAQGPISVVHEGKEPPFLMNTLKREECVSNSGDGSHLPKQGAYAAHLNHNQGRGRFGLKIVAAYTSDYEMYLKARDSSSLPDFNNNNANSSSRNITTPPLSARIGRWRVMRPDVSHALKFN